MSYDSEIEDILGGGPPDPHAGLEKPPSRAERRASKTVSETRETMSLTGAKQGVTVYWLAQVFGMTAESIRRKLADCPPKSTSGKGYKYDVKVAAAYLVDPEIDLEQYMKTMKAADLPPMLQKEIWDAKLKRQKWEKEAGDLWHTTDVMAVISSAFATIKSSIQLWPDTVERQEGLTDPQRELLVVMGDTLQDEIYQGLLEQARSKSTRASIHDLEEEGDDNEGLEDVL